ncbi:MAG TPA: hypothetical protein VFD92_07640 [Candidatus Binatia bacterium]|nr:hypothetical protein [Candidatus Binatia bacterium]
MRTAGATATSDRADDVGLKSALIAYHLRVGWWSLLVFLSAGLVLESLHAFKIGFYLDVGMESRRLMWTLAHSHGTLFAVLNIAFAATLWMAEREPARSWVIASRCLVAALVLMPGGFFLAGLFIHGGDPGVGVLLVPLGGFALLAGVLAVALGLAPGRK